MGIKRLFNDGWSFTKQPLHTGYEEVMKDNSFAPVDLPHDWLIYQTKDLYEDGTGWYRKEFEVEKKEGHLFLRFEGVYMDCKIYINKQMVQEWKYGYSTFDVEITDYVTAGINEVAVRVDFQSPNSRWYSGAGIYRNVYLIATSENYIALDGVYISCNKKEQNWEVAIETETIVQDTAAFDGVCHTIFDAQDQEVVSLTAQQKECTLMVEAPEIWDIEHPVCYRLQTQLICDGKVVDTVQNSFGFRTIELTTDKGFFLNGRHVKLNGVCEHHDLGALGAAVNREAIRRKFTILQQMGVNSVRTSHNMPSVEMMELADEMGMLIVSESFDMWERSKTEYDYARFFPEWMPRDVASWIRRDRNHPSVIMWSIGNEISDTHADERGQEITRMLMREVALHDKNENAKMTIGSNYMPWENARKCADIVKVAGYNYAERFYTEHHEQHPDWMIYGSETSSLVQSRGIYHFPLKAGILSDDDKQCSSLGNSQTSWGTKSMENCILAERDHPFSLGQYLWSGFDYIGEPTPYHTKNSYFGQIDTAGFPKDAFYFYQAEWTDYKKKPMIHIFPYWDFNEGQLIDVRVCSNAPVVELFLNGESRGKVTLEHKSGTRLISDYQIPYTKGCLLAKGYDEEGNEIAGDEQHSFGDAVTLELTTDKETMQADGRDMLFVTISAKDAEGYPVANAVNRVEVNVSGAGRLVGLDNGDSTDLDEYKGVSRRLFSGKLLAMIAAKTVEGEIVVNVSSAGMQSQTLKLHAVKAAVEPGTSAFMENKPTKQQLGKGSDEIPTRKIELICHGSKTFTPENRTIEVEAKVYPGNATDQAVVFSAVTDMGVTSNIARVEAKGNKALITALGDGSFRLRCMNKSNSDSIRLISQIELTAQGLGTAFLNPYELISGSLYSFKKGELGNGNERGVATDRGSETQVGFTQIDFGDFGSDEVTLPLFALDGGTYKLQMWEGEPNQEGSTLLADTVYQKPSIWNVYQEETYKLSKRLKGISSFYLVFWQKAHIKGFYFTKQNKAFAKLAAGEADKIYGDSFHIADQVVEKIGNNVSLCFENMDFKEAEMLKIRICGRANVNSNTVQIRFKGEEDVSQAVEFPSSAEYQESLFELTPVKGIQQVTFVFLPGSNFDFKWFQFEA